MTSKKYIDHTLNTSPSKAAHSFGKATRFKQPKQTGQFYYYPKQIKSNLTFKFGTQERDSFRKDYQTRSPSPTSYNIKSEFDKTNKGYSFGQIKNQKSKLERKLNQIQRRLYTEDDKLFKFSPNKTSATTRVTNFDREQTSNRSKYYDSPSKDVPGPGAYNTFSCFGVAKGYWNNPY